MTQVEAIEDILIYMAIAEASNRAASSYLYPVSLAVGRDATCMCLDHVLVCALIFVP